MIILDLESSDQNATCGGTSLTCSIELSRTVTNKDQETGNDLFHLDHLLEIKNLYLEVLKPDQLFSGQTYL